VDVSARAPLRTAVIGAGFVGPHHVDAVRRGGLADVVAIAGTSLERARLRARQLGVAEARTVADVLADPAIDVVHVCTPNASHAELAAAALEAGKHVMVEKPLALTVADADRLSHLAGERGLHGGVTFTYRGYPMVRAARQLVTDGRLGRVRMAHGAYLQDWLLEATDYNWRVDPAAGGPSRAVADIGSHWFDTVEFVSRVSVRQVFADLHTFLPTRVRPIAQGETFAQGHGRGEEVRVESEDGATLLLRMDDGAVGSLVLSQVAPGHANDFSFELAGERAALAWRQEDPEWLRIGERGGGVTATQRTPADPATHGVPSLPAGHPEGWGDALRDLMSTYYSAIAHDAGEAPAGYPTFADGARAVRFVAAVLESASTERWVTLAD
jgi:predicted dehydrogenase